MDIEANKAGSLRDFQAEVEDILNRLGKGLSAIERSFKAGSITPALVNKIFRAAHTFKGVCAIYEYTEMVRLSHAMEDALDSVRVGRVLLTGALLDELMRSYSLLLKMTASTRGDRVFKGEVDIIIALFKKFEIKRLDRRKEDQIDSKILDMLTDYERNNLFESVKNKNRIILVESEFKMMTFDADYDAYVKLFEPDIEIIATLPDKKQRNDDSLGLQLLVATRRNVPELEKRLKAKCKLLYDADKDKDKGATLSSSDGLKGGPHGVSYDSSHAEQTLKSSANSVRVDIDKLDKVMSIVGELGLLRADLSRLSKDLKRDMPYSSHGFELTRLEKHLDRRFTELRDRVLDLRLVQMSQLFDRYETMLGQLCRRTGKEVRMQTFGAHTEIDKLMVEELADPIMHMIRNVVDHAIESPEQREALGKDRVGLITFSAYQKGNRVVVEVSDDGCGIDEELVLNKALEKGLITESYASNLSRLEKLDLIFLPALTTMDVVSDMSGRGVGLDVVKENVANLSGVIEIDTVRGKGTKFILTIPITLAITQALIVEDAGERYALPLSTVNEVITIDPKDIFMQDGFEFIRVMDRAVPLARLGEVMGAVPSSEQKAGPLHGVLTGIAEHRLCITAQRIVEQLDVVVKPISSVAKLPGIAGATDLGMGEKGTILVLDVRDILANILRDKAGARPTETFLETPLLEGTR